MNNLDENMNMVASFEEFCKKYTENIFTKLTSIDVTKLKKVVEKLEGCYKNKNTIFLIGNGGSASTCSHMANDIGVGVYKNSNKPKPFKIMSLTDNIPIITAITNDDNYENIFVRQLEMYYQEGDILIAISASGNSPNLVKAVNWVRKYGGDVVSFVGFDGGILKELSDISIHIKSEKGEYGVVEDIHLITNHLISLWLQQNINTDVK